MNLPVSGTVIILVILIGGIIAIGAFIWAVRNKQFSDMNSGAYVIFDDEEPVGNLTDNTFGQPALEEDSLKGGNDE